MMRFSTLSVILLGLTACNIDFGLKSVAGPDAGSVAPERSTEWVEVLSAHPSADDLHFGLQVALDDQDIYVTSQARDTTAWRLTRYSRRNGSWALATELRAEDLQADLSGPGAIHVRDDRVWLGVPGAGAGGEVWELSRELQLVRHIPSPVQDAEFGTSIVANSEWLFVGAARQNRSRGAIHVFQRMATSLVPADVLTPPQAAGFTRLGHALAQDNLHLYVGAPDFCSPATGCGPGAVYVYTLDASRIWQQEPVWQSPEAGLLGFGHDLAARGEGRVVISTPFSEECADDEPNCLRHPGQAYMASGDVSAPTWSASLRPEVPRMHQEYFGTAVDAHGPHVVIGGPGDNGCASTVQGGDCTQRGVVFVMTDGEPYRRLRPLIVGQIDRFGGALAVSEDVMVVAAPNQAPPGRTDTSGGITIFELREILLTN